MKNRVLNYLQLNEYNMLIIIDQFDFFQEFDYTELLRENNYQVFIIDSIEELRVRYETGMKDSEEKIAFVFSTDHYIPYDVRQIFTVKELSYAKLFSKIPISVINDFKYDMDLLAFCYDDMYLNINKTSKNDISRYIYSVKTLSDYIHHKDDYLSNVINNDLNYKEWQKIAKLNARLEYYASLIGMRRDQSLLNRNFQEYILHDYKNLSTRFNNNAPAIITKTLEYISMKNTKNLLLVMDGMSLYDFEVIKRELIEVLTECNIYEETSFAIIPTITSISRQSLMSGKYPIEHEKPFSLSLEEKQFYESINAFGFPKEVVQFGRSYEELPKFNTKFSGIIINDIDDMVHGDTQERYGMLQGLKYLCKNSSLKRMLTSYLEHGFTIYLTADHGNTLCTGVGNSLGFGVETETKSKRMVVVKEFGEIPDNCKSKMYEYPGYYLPKEYKYYICNDNTSLDVKDKNVMTHGGITLEEVIVPFVTLWRK